MSEPDRIAATDYVSLLKAAKEHVNASVLYRRFIDGTPLENDIAVWMADFASDRLATVERECELKREECREAGLAITVTHRALEGAEAAKEGFTTMRTLIAKLLTRFRDFEYRHTYVESFEDSFIATQIKVLREQRGLSQAALAARAGMKQSQISPMEDVNHGSWKIRTLRRLGRAFDLVLVVRFETFGSALREIDKFSRESLERSSFEKDQIFHQQQAAAEAAVGTSPP